MGSVVFSTCRADLEPNHELICFQELQSRSSSKYDPDLRRRGFSRSASERKLQMAGGIIWPEDWMFHSETHDSPTTNVSLSDTAVSTRETIAPDNGAERKSPGTAGDEGENVFF